MSDLVDVVNRMVGKAWAPPEFDCWGFLRRVYVDAYGIDIAPLRHVAGRPQVDAVFADNEAASGRWQLVTVPQLGDAVAMGRSQRPHHCGIWMTGGLIAHCSHPMGVSVATMRNLQAMGWGSFRTYRHRDRA